MLLIGDQVGRGDRLAQKAFDLKELLDHVNQVVTEAHPKFRLRPPRRESAWSRRETTTMPVALPLAPAVTERSRVFAAAMPEDAEGRVLEVTRRAGCYDADAHGTATTFILLAFEGPDAYARAGGLRRSRE